MTNLKISQIADRVDAIATDDLVAIARKNGANYENKALKLTSALRERLIAARTYYVRPDGDDANDGLSNSSSGAFLTIQKALTTVGALDANLQVITIQVADGTYNEALALPTVVGSFFERLILRGNTTTPANCVINATGSGVTCDSCLSYWNVEGFKIVATVEGVLAKANTGLALKYMEFGQCANHIRVGINGYVIVQTRYTISGAAARHVYVLGGKFVINSQTITISASMAFSSAFASASTLAWVQFFGCTFSTGAFSITGKKYDVTLNSVLNLSTTVLPGDVAGTTATGGQAA